jgi:hypothetical protein
MLFLCVNFTLEKRNIRSYVTILIDVTSLVALIRSIPVRFVRHRANMFMWLIVHVRLTLNWNCTRTSSTMGWLGWPFKDFRRNLEIMGGAAVKYAEIRSPRRFEP